jgi:aerobic carbon-monoxide dehydrogenase medium subunit
LGAVAPTPLRAKEAEDIAKGKKITGENLREIAEAASSICAPISDARGSAEYRLKMIKVLVPRAITQAVEQIKREA